MRTAKIVLMAAIVMVISVCCKAPEKPKQIGNAGPPTIVYKTKKDYSKKVPVTLSPDKSKIISYPAPQDIMRNGSFAYPTPLAKGYLLDNRGVSANTAFLNITYEEYSKLKEVPSLADLYSQIEDKNPICHCYDLGSRTQFKDIVPELNSIIEHHKLKDYKKLK